MPASLFVALALLAALGSGLLAGTFGAFTCFGMQRHCGQAAGAQIAIAATQLCSSLVVAVGQQLLAVAASGPDLSRRCRAIAMRSRRIVPTPAVGPLAPAGTAT